MDDVDAAEALQARNMLLSGDWVTQHLNGTVYLDKAPLKYWITASLYSVFGVHDWVARLPAVLAAILLCLLVAQIGRWAENPETSFYSGLIIATSIGLFLFTRTVIPDVILTLFVTAALWCFMRLLESETLSRFWLVGLYGSMGCAVLTKGLIGLFFPLAIGLVYLAAARRLMDKSTWRRLHPVLGIFIFLAVAAPWHVAAALRNPPVADFTLHAGPHFGGRFRGFFWFYFINEQLLRFLNERWPRDYNTVPRLWFWLSQIIWFFPWSLSLPAVSQLSFRPVDRGGQVRLLAVCWIAVVMVFFTFSTTQEYYSMPIYPAIALLLASAMSTSNKWLPIASKVSAVVCLCLSAVLVYLLIRVWSMPTPGDIYAALAQHPDLYTLSLGHMADLTLPAFAYLRLPLEVAACGLAGGGLAILVSGKKSGYIATAIMLAVFFQAARLALVTFDPYLSSFAVAQRLNQSPKGTIIICGKYNPLSSVFFYSEDHALQNEDDLDILEYGSLAPGAPKISVSDSEMKQLWDSAERVYLVAKAPKLRHVADILGPLQPNLLLQSGDKYLFTNRAVKIPVNVYRH